MPQFSIDAARGQQIYEFKELTRISTRSWLAQQVVFTKTGLTAGTHSSRIEVSRKNPLSGAPGETTGCLSNIIGDAADFVFTGDSVTLLTSKLANRGHAKIYIDGIFQQEIDPYSSGYLQPQEVAFTKTGLGVGTHTITVEVAPQPLTFTGTEISWIAAKRPYRGMAKVYKNVAAITLTLCGFSYVVYFAALRREAL